MVLRNYKTNVKDLTKVLEGIIIQRNLCLKRAQYKDCIIHLIIFTETYALNEHNTRIV